MFLTEEQRNQAILLLLGPVRLKHYWTAKGPTRKACDAIENGAPLSTGETIMLRVAFDLYNGHGGATFDNVAHRLDTVNTVAVGTLMAALAQSRVHEWIAARDSMGDPFARLSDEARAKMALHTLDFMAEAIREGSNDNRAQAATDVLRFSRAVMTTGKAPTS